jgi:hypothetical protein
VFWTISRIFLRKAPATERGAELSEEVSWANPEQLRYEGESGALLIAGGRPTHSTQRNRLALALQAEVGSERIGSAAPKRWSALRRGIARTR